ncbi:exopolysaccharide biosynthesis protein [Beijerinckiaceae bacterium]|nr:exopolysaccharide biosynthesis protein [Beijerinckiaceae bacterium]
MYMLDAGFTILRRQLQRSSLGSRRVIVGGPAKRLFDIVAASLIIICIVPLIVFVSLAMKLLDPGPVIYPHTRIGHCGRRFKCLKFRSMVVGADEVLKALLASDPEIRDIWERTQKLPNDPRITPWGRFLRHSSLDELPQLINVLRGDMSLVGPRPIVPSEMARYGDKLGLYLSARPGLTGLWQISGRSDCSYDRRIELDAEYVRYWRFSTDLIILLRTVGAVIARKGVY